MAEGQAQVGRSTSPLRSGVMTGLATGIVCVGLLAPNHLGHFTAGSFVRLPLELVLGAAVLVMVPERVRLRVATALGLALALLSLVKLLDMGFFAVLARPFDPVLDWTLLGDGLTFLRSTFGGVGALGAVAVVLLLVVLLGAVLVWAVRHLALLAAGREPVVVLTTAALAVLWVSCGVFGAGQVSGLPLAAADATLLVEGKVRAVSEGIRDRDAFAAEVAVDRFRETAPDHLLAGLRGKHVLVAFVESYGRSAVEDPSLNPPVVAMLEQGNRRLTAAGFSARSAYLTSPTAGGGSWLAHATLLSGVWIDNQQRYRNLLASDRLSLTEAFRRAGWRTAGIMPGITTAWPEGKYYGYDTVYDSHHLGYRGPNFSWATMPDQYTLARYQHLERSSSAGPATMAVLPLVSSHAPWSPVPRMVPDQEVGDGSVFRSMADGPGDPPQAILTRDAGRVRSDYVRAIDYSLDSVVSYLETYGDDDTVLIVLGDHQPAPLVTGADAGRDVPITIVARDPQVLAQIAGWRWTPGLKPASSGPVWRMDSFRDHFLTAFGSR